MAILALAKNPAIPKLNGLSGGTIARGDLVYANHTTGVLLSADGTNDTTLTILGIADQACTIGQYFDYFPLMGQGLYRVDCTNATNVNQLYKRQIMTDAQHVANSSSDTATIHGHFLPIALSGTAQLIGYFLVLQQAAA